MDRKQIIVVLKDILDNCEKATSGHVMIMPSNANNILAKGEQLHIIANFDSETRQCIETVLKKYSLKIKEEGNKIIIYESITQAIASL